MKKPRRVNWGKVVLCPCGAQMVRVRVAYPKCKTEFNAWLCPHEYRIKRKVGDSPPRNYGKSTVLRKWVGARRAAKGVRT